MNDDDDGEDNHEVVDLNKTIYTIYIENESKVTELFRHFTHLLIFKSSYHHHHHH